MKQVADSLLQLRAVQLSVNDPFAWASGIKSPVYFDNRKINSDIKVRKTCVDAFVSLIREQFSDAKIIAGVATGGIPLGILVADKMDLPFIYVRQEPKEHGLMKQVEGTYKKGQKVVVIEDHISTGGSSLKAINILKKEALDVLGIVSVTTYGFKNAIDLFKSENIRHYSLCDLDTILSVALEKGIITEKEKETILDFRENQN